MKKKINSNDIINIPEIKLHYVVDNAIPFSKQIGSSEDAADIFRKIIKPEEIELREQAVVLYVNRANKVIGYYIHSTGGLDQTVMDVRLILAVALKSLSIGMILCHNHPSGSIKPSLNDTAFTNKLRDAAKQMNITLLDHIILAKTGYYSFADEGFLSLGSITTGQKKDEIVCLDLFSGTGGFAKGFQDAGYHFKKHYYSEIDKYSVANYQYNFKNAINLGDVTKINTKKIEQPTLITFGSPCQDISIAGKREGLKGKRSGLFFEAVRIIRECRPEVFIFENVKGLFSSNEGKDFEVVLQTFADIGLYDIQWQLLNTCWFLPQNRERIYLVGSLRGKARPQIFPIGESPALPETLGKERTARGKDIASAITQTYSKGVHGRGETYVDVLHWKNSKDKWVQEAKKNSPALKAQSDLVRQPLIVNGAAYRTRSYKGEAGKIEVRKDTNANQLTTAQKDSMVLFHVPEATKKGYATATEGDSINLSFLEANKRRGRVGKGIANTIDTGVCQYAVKHGSIRRLTPVECERLQGFPDDWTKYGMFDGIVKEISDAQRYKMLGNAVSVPVVEAIAERMLSVSKEDNISSHTDDEQIKRLTLELELELFHVKQAA